MNLYLLTQDVNKGYDTYDSCVIAAETEEQAKHMHPSSYENNEKWYENQEEKFGVWTLPKNINAELIGIASDNIQQPRVICTSFNAG